MRFCVGLVVLALCACRPPEAAPAPADASPTPGVETTAPAAAPSKAGEDDTAVLEAVLTHDSFAMYLHPEVAGRIPIVVSGDARPRGPIDLELHGAKVQLEASVGADDPAVLISEWNRDTASAHVELTYPIEGVVATFELERTADGWHVTNADVAER